MSLLERDIQPDALLNLPPTDLAFLWMTGRVDFVSVDSFLANIVQKANKDAILWGPQARLLGRIMTKAWDEEGSVLIDAILSAIDFTGDISVDEAAIKKAFKKYKNVGKKTWAVAKKKIRSAMELTVRKATTHFNKQRKEIEKADLTKEQFELFMLEAFEDHLEAFATEYPERILYPEVTKLAKIVQVDSQFRALPKAQLKKRLQSIAKLPTKYFKTASDVHAGRLWQFTGLQMAHEREVTDFQVVAQHDKKTCPVCRRLDGRFFPVERIYTKALNFLDERGNADKIAEAFPFPRYDDLKGLSRDQLREKDLIPPYHNLCRCEIIMLWKRTEPIGNI